MKAPTAEEILHDTKQPLPHPLWILSLAVITVCGGYGVGLVPLKPLISALIFFIEGILVCWAIINISGSESAANPLHDNVVEAVGFSLVFVVILTIIVCVLHIWWPKTLATIGAVINLAVIGLAIWDKVSESK